MKRKGISAVERGERRSKRIYEEAIEKKIHLAIKVTPNGASFFVGKKDGKERIVQDYRYLNEWMIKNNYSLPLISNVLENIGTKKLFTKMDLR